ncbi:hypothetical protein DOTSEDRAFT_31194 [Dothistroma septosporum NZE10]|uniref:MIT domain-containing protein n=1 Tax=Dothistroma septosporum (strain NZE10 / CBS 128990) TaxID=675120 RepID=N1Q581_DOTSN|nr:hypothetical protein DOTSEDRAFT_31194 [Dothistroma septosporum NZE10]
MDESEYPWPTTAPPVSGTERDAASVPPPSSRPRPISPELSTARSDAGPPPSPRPAPASLTLPVPTLHAMQPPRPEEAESAMSLVRRALAHARHLDKKCHFREAMDRYGRALEKFEDALERIQLLPLERHDLESIVDEDRQRCAALRRLDAAGDLHNAPVLPKLSARPPSPSTEPFLSYQYAAPSTAGKRKRGETQGPASGSKMRRIQPSIELRERNDSLDNLEENTDVEAADEHESEDPEHAVKGRTPGFVRDSTPLPGRIENLGPSNPLHGLTTYALATSQQARYHARIAGGHAMSYQHRDHNHIHFEAGGSRKGFDQLIARMAADASSENTLPPDVH